MPSNEKIYKKKKKKGKQYLHSNDSINKEEHHDEQSNMRKSLETPNTTQVLEYLSNTFTFFG